MIINKQNWSLYIIATIVILLLVGLIIFFWHEGLFDFSGTDASSKIVGAVLTLLGSLVAAVLTFIGVILKQSYDQQAEQRLKLEAAVRALQLFSTSDGKPTPEIERDGALFTLASLGQYELTLQLVENLLGKNELNASTTSSLFDIVIRNGDTKLKNRAIDVLYDHAECMVTKQGSELPQCLSNWNPELSSYSREWGIFSISKIILARPVLEWSSKYLNNLNVLLGALYLAWKSENIPRIKNDSGAMLKVLLNAYPSGYAIFTPRMTIDIESVRNEVIDSKCESDVCFDIVKRLKEWVFTK